jgi:hypothetical protein
MWREMIGEVERSPTLQFLCGMLELVVGALVHLANPGPRMIFSPAS